MIPLLVVCMFTAAPAANPNPKDEQVKPLKNREMVKLLEKIDTTMYSPGEDYKALVYMEQKQPGKPDRVFELYIFRRDKDSALLMLFTKPKIETGKGYLRIGNNMWSYTPKIGKWERHTVRDRIAGTDALTGDFDTMTLAQNFKPKHEAVDKLGTYIAHRLRLDAKPNVEVPFPTSIVWTDSKTDTLLKIQFLAESGRIAATRYYPKWIPLQGKDKQVYYPKEVRIYNEIDKGAQTLIMVKQADLAELPRNLFTKAWLESQSR